MHEKVSVCLCGVERDAMGGFQGDSREGDVHTIHRIREKQLSRAQTARCVVKEFSGIFKHRLWTRQN